MVQLEEHHIWQIIQDQQQAQSAEKSKVPSRRIAVLTSGGDAPGMNCALRSIVRIALVKGCRPFAVMEGYQGLVEGGDKIREMKWSDVQGIMMHGGTIIGTARCKEFRMREGRLKAALNLSLNGIDSLIVIGGDGSLTGADLLRSEWQSLLQELHQSNQLPEDKFQAASRLSIVGIVGSIDNDMASTDITIGAVSSLHRICEAVDSISYTASSHQRAFVIEVMGRNCGWLALMAAIACGADWLFIPERPPQEGWQDQLCQQLHRDREMGKRKSIIIVSEGAVDRELKRIEPEYVKNLICERTGIDTRVTTLGHVQRGGSPAFYDRILGTVQGLEAVEAVLRSKPDSEAPLIGVSENKVTVQPLMNAVRLTKECGDAIKSKDFVKALSLRDPEFLSSLETFNSTANYGALEKVPDDKRLRIAILHVGAPAGGMNAATKAAVRYAINRGHTPIAISNGFTGLISGDFKELKWTDVESWTIEGGSNLGTNRAQPVDDLALCAYQLQTQKIQAMIIVGGFEAYTAVSQLEEARSTFIPFCIPIILIPATISNNIPSTEYSLGSDTALNVIIEACDRIRQSAYSSRKRVFIVETQGGNCGFLASMAGIAAGATCAYIPEEGINIDLLSKDCKHLVKQFREGANQGRVILRNECVSSTYTTDVISKIFADEGKGVFDSRSAILGHIQQGGMASPLDRVRASRFAVKAMKWIEGKAFPALDIHQKMKHNGGHLSDLLSPTITNRSAIQRDDDENKKVEFNHTEARTDVVATGVYTPDADSCVMIGIRGTEVVTTQINHMKQETDFTNRKPKKAWWKSMNRLIRILAKYEYVDRMPNSSRSQDALP